MKSENLNTNKAPFTKGGCPQSGQRDFYKDIENLSVSLCSTSTLKKGSNNRRTMKDSGISWIGAIPENWKISKIKNHFNIIAGSTPDSLNPLYWDGNIIWVTPADYKTSDKFISNGRKNITKKGYNSCNTTIVPKGSIIFSKRAPIGSVAIASNPLCTNQGCLSCVVKDKSNITYYYYIMASFTNEFELLGSGTTFKEISASDFGNFAIPFPPLAEQQAIADF